MPELKGKAGIRAFLLSRVGQIVSTEEIREASGNQVQYSRRLRELRDEEGWPIESHLDSSDLKPGQYRLAKAPPKKTDYRFKRKISSAVRAQVRQRNGFTCQMCGIGPGSKTDSGRRVILQVGHIIPKSAGGKDTMDNLQALCSGCNQGAKNITPAPPGRILVLATLRKANRKDQKYAYEWLARKFKDKK